MSTAPKIAARSPACRQPGGNNQLRAAKHLAAAGETVGSTSRLLLSLGIESVTATMASKKQTNYD
jgi:hypothetical protein